MSETFSQILGISLPICIALFVILREHKNRKKFAAKWEIIEELRKQQKIVEEEECVRKKECLSKMQSALDDVINSHENLINSGYEPDYDDEMTTPIILGKNEHYLTETENLDISELKTKTKYVGGSNGASIRVCKGLTLRTAAFKGEPVETIYKSEIGDGTLVLTTKKIYLVSETKTIVLNYGKIDSITECMTIPNTIALSCRPDYKTPKTYYITLPFKYDCADMYAKFWRDLIFLYNS